MMWLISIVVETACRLLSNAQSGVRRQSIISLHKKLLRQQTDLFVAFWGDQFRLVFCFLSSHKCRYTTRSVAAVGNNKSRNAYTMSISLAFDHSVIATKAINGSLVGSSDWQWSLQVFLGQTATPFLRVKSNTFSPFHYPIACSLFAKMCSICILIIILPSQFEELCIGYFRSHDSDFLLKWICSILVAAVKRFW